MITYSNKEHKKALIKLLIMSYKLRMSLMMNTDCSMLPLIMKSHFLLVYKLQDGKLMPMIMMEEQLLVLQLQKGT